MKRIVLVAIATLCVLNAWGQLNTERMISVGRNALYYQDYVLSIQYFNQVIKAKPYMVEPYYYRAVAKLQLEDYVGAEQDLNKLITLTPYSPIAYYARCFVLLHQNKYKEAERDISRALELSPENSNYLLTRIAIYCYQERYDDAINDLDFVIRRASTPELNIEKGKILLAKGDTIQALQHFDEYIARDTTNAEALGGRAMVNLMLNNTEAALTDYNKAIALHSQNPNHYVNRSLLRYNKNDFYGALDDCDKALAIVPDNAQALFNRSLIRAHIGDYNKAVGDLNRIIERNPLAYDAIMQRAIVQMECRNYQAAIADFTTVINKYPEAVSAYYGRATAYNSIGSKQQAYRDMQTSIRLTEQRKKNPPKENDEPDVDIHQAEEESAVAERARLFSSSSSVISEQSKGNSSSKRGLVQNRTVDVVPEPNFAISYYEREDRQVLGLITYSSLIDNYNRQHSNRLPIKVVNVEMPLTTDLAAMHFASIDEISAQLEKTPNDANLHFERAIDYALVQDFAAALVDFTAVINSDGANALAYFQRANIRYKQLEFRMNNPEETIDFVDASKPKVDKTYSYDFEMIMRDYDKCILLEPSFSYAYFNRANILAEIKEYKRAIENYTKAIECNPNFAEAYFNRGLVYIYLGDNQKGVLDLSKAGEMGLIRAYSLLKKMR